MRDVDMKEVMRVSKDCTEAVWNFDQFLNYWDKKMLNRDLSSKFDLDTSRRLLKTN